MEFLKLITERRSVRKYEGTIPHEDLTAILRAAQQAPSWKNSQTTRWYVVPVRRSRTLRRWHARTDWRGSSLQAGFREASAVPAS